MDIAIPPLPQSSQLNSAGHPEAAGRDLVESAHEFGAPEIACDKRQQRGVLFVKDSRARVVIKREGYQGLAHLHETLD